MKSFLGLHYNIPLQTIVMFRDSHSREPENNKNAMVSVIVSRLRNSNATPPSVSLFGLFPPIQHASKALRPVGTSCPAAHVIHSLIAPLLPSAPPSG